MQEQQEAEQPTVITAIAAAHGTAPPTVISALGKNHQEAYRMKLAGRQQQEIADHFKVDTSTIYRWQRKVEEEALAALEGSSIFNLITEEVKRLTDLEEQARTGAAETKSDRAKAMYLGEARRAAVSRQNLLFTAGILPRQPEILFKAVRHFKPAQEEAKQEKEPQTREEAVEQLIEAQRFSKTL